MNWKFCSVAATVAAFAAFVGGCTAQETPQASPPVSSTLVTTTTPTATTPVPPSFSSDIYESNFDRQVAISAVTREFGLVVMQEARKNGRGTWGVFDTYCASDNRDGGFVSQGHVPVVGEQCTTQHTPIYSRPPIQISTTYEVLPNNQQNFVRADVNIAPNCRVQTDHSLHGDVRQVRTTTISTDMKIESTSTAKNEAEARAIDEKVIACIKDTRP